MAGQDLYIPNGIPDAPFTLEQIAAIWKSANPAQAQWQWTMAAIAWVESARTGVKNIVYSNPATTEYSVGLWQINFGSGNEARNTGSAPFYSPTILAADASKQAQAAAYLWANGAGISNWVGDSVASYLVAHGITTPLNQQQATSILGGANPVTAQPDAAFGVGAGVGSSASAGISPPSNVFFAPIVVLPPTPGFGDVSVSDIIINGTALTTDVTAAVTDVIVERSIANASTVTVELTDPTRQILQSGLFNQGDSLELDGLNFTLVQFNKASDQLELVFEATGVYNLRQETGLITYTGPPGEPQLGGTDLAGFAAQLIAQVPGLKLVAQESPLAAANAIQIGRGTTNDPDEDSWTCLVRLAGTAGWRVWESEEVIYFGSDPYWLTFFPSQTTLLEFTPQIMDIDFEYDWGQPFGNATATAMTDYITWSPGQAVTLEGMGPADGVWLVNDMQRDLYNPQATMTLMVPMTPAELIASTATSQSTTTNEGSPSSGTPALTATIAPLGNLNSGTSFTVTANVSGKGFGVTPTGTVAFTYVTATGVNPEGGTASPAYFHNNSTGIKLDKNGNAVLTSEMGLSTGVWNIAAYYSGDNHWATTDTSAQPIVVTIN